MTIGDAVRERIQELCALRGYTLNKLATVSGVTQSTVNNIISGRNNSATVATIKKLCDGLDISIVDFFNTERFLTLEQEIK
ncbi:transcriptional regulator [Clostridia bacterium]|nr:transcriptional regulator [Clostridia bacterium]GHV15132.1 transcriptional regulator [Clostridia bacterium]